MRIVRRTRRTDVSVTAPPSKAHTLRALFISALADGRSLIRGPLLGDDQRRAIDCLRGLGVTIEEMEEGLAVTGSGGRFEPACDLLYVGESGVSANFLIAMACLADRPVIVTGAPRVKERPIGEVVSGLRQLGCRLDYVAREGFPPVRAHGGGMPGGEAAIRGDITSQYHSAMLTVAPYAQSPVTLRCTTDMTERPYLGITLAMMADAGVAVRRRGFAEFLVANGHAYRPQDVTIEGDYSSASFFFEAAAVCGIRVAVGGLNPQSVQGDRCFLELVQRMGCVVEPLRDGFAVTGGDLEGIDADMADTPDLVPPLAVTAAFARGTTQLRNVGHLRHKESDRLAVLVDELRKMGVHAACDERTLQVEGCPAPDGARIDPHNDHRIAMSFAAAGLATGDQIIEDEGCVAKSFPDFWDRLGSFG
jgi:3-phosphoshikimate 1-carboxyvinyltransferase